MRFQRPVAASSSASASSSVRLGLTLSVGASVGCRRRTVRRRNTGDVQIANKWGRGFSTEEGIGWATEGEMALGISYLNESTNDCSEAVVLDRVSCTSANLSSARLFEEVHWSGRQAGHDRGTYLWEEDQRSRRGEGSLLEGFAALAALWRPAAIRQHRQEPHATEARDLGGGGRGRLGARRGDGQEEGRIAAASMSGRRPAFGPTHKKARYSTSMGLELLAMMIEPFPGANGAWTPLRLVLRNVTSSDLIHTKPRTSSATRVVTVVTARARARCSGGMTSWVRLAEGS